MEEEEFLGEGDESALQNAQQSDDINFEDIDEDLSKYQDDELVKHALTTGADLKQYAKRIEEDLRAVERASIHDYLKESENLAQLHSDIRACDSVLEKMEGMLTAFQSDLGKISGEIASLQQHSLTMGRKLRNRRGAEEKLANFIDGIAVPPRLIHAICEEEVNEAYLEYLLGVRKHSVFADSPAARNAAATQEIAPEIEKLRLKAVERVRSFILHQINSLGKPHTNFQIKQQNVLLKYKFFTQFLKDHGSAAFEEVRDAYVDTMSKIYVSGFRVHVRNMSKVILDTKENATLVDSEPPAFSLSSLPMSLNLFGGGGGGGAAAKTSQHRDVGFSIGDRAAVMSDIGKPGLLFHVEIEQQRRHRVEAVFRSVCHLLMDAATSEYLFISDFFGDTSMFHNIFKSTLDSVRDEIESLVGGGGGVASAVGVVAGGGGGGGNDAIGLLLMIRVNEEHMKVMQKRRIEVLQTFFDSLKMLFWPRFKSAMDAHVASTHVQNIKTLISSTTDKEPHYIARRFAELSSALLSLNSDEQGDSLMRTVDILATNVDKLLVRISLELSPRVKQLVFLINQYYLIRTILAEKNVTALILDKFDALLASQTTQFVDYEISNSFPKLHKFVKTRQQQEGSAPPLEPSAVEPIVADFATNWKNGIEQINTSVMGSFNDMRNGMELLKQVLSQLLSMYSMFVDDIKRDARVNAAVSKQLVPIPTFLYEIKRFSRNL